MIKFLPFLIWDMCISDSTKNFKIIYSWFPSTPSLLWCHILNSNCRTFVQDVNTLIYCFRLKRFWDSPSCQQVSHHIENGSVFPLWYTILLWCISTCQLSSNAMNFTKNFKFGWVIFSTTICSEGLNGVSYFIFHTSLKVFKCTKSFWFFL